MFEKVLIANRGEIANRIIRSLQKLKIEAVAIYDDREKNAQYLQMANNSVNLGSGSLRDTFLNIDKLIAIAKDHGCDAIHPGYGFLAENAEFARRCKSNAIVFIGPQPDTIAIMGDKQESTKFAQSIGLPVIPQVRGTIKEILQNSTNDFFPCLIKASAGGGGKGMRRAENRDELEDLLNRTSAEAEKYFANGEVYIEKYLDNPRHVEVQILADSLDNVIHLFERECSIQRRFQKIIEEAPAVGLSQSQKYILYNDALKLSKKVGYIGAGTVEFLIDALGNHFFLEMNTRIQVEHGVTELVTGIDIVEEQLIIAAGEPISQKALHASIKGHAIEARLYAEDPANDFKPSPGKIKLLRFPEGKDIRIDVDFCSDSEVLTDFDPMMAKIMAHDTDRKKAITTLIEAVRRSIVHGVKNNLDSLANILNESDFQSNKISTHYFKNHPEVLRSSVKISENERNTLLAAGLYVSMFRFPYKAKQQVQKVIPEYWRILKVLNISLDDIVYSIELKSVSSADLSFFLTPDLIEVSILEETSDYVFIDIAGKKTKVFYSWDKVKLAISLSIDYREYIFHRNDFLSGEDFTKQPDAISLDESAKILAPLSGKVIRVDVDPDQKVQQGETLLVIESMKMENEIRLSSTALIKQIFVNKGQMVNEGDILIHTERIN